MLEIPDQLGQGPRKTSKPGTEPNQDQQIFGNLGPIRSCRSPDLVSRGFLVASIFIVYRKFHFDYKQSHAWNLA